LFEHPFRAYAPALSGLCRLNRVGNNASLVNNEVALRPDPGKRPPDPTQTHANIGEFCLLEFRQQLGTWAAYGLNRMMTIRRANERGHANHGWLDAHHTFSFANYHDPNWMGFRSLRVINDDTIAGGGGFGTHPHRDMEIITYILSGALQHRDSMGHEAVLKAGDVQRISAGTGIAHSEFNYSPIEPVHLLQIWIQPERKNVKPAYAERSFGNGHAKPGLTLVASPDGRDGSMPINQDADVWLARLDEGTSATHTLKTGRHAWVQVAEGEVTLNGQTLHAGDGAALSEETALALAAKGPAQALLFDLN
jgi:redox-sensitive bicupin YhaK (pirin superfamily)